MALQLNRFIFIITILFSNTLFGQNNINVAAKIVTSFNGEKILTIDIENISKKSIIINKCLSCQFGETQGIVLYYFDVSKDSIPHNFIPKNQISNYYKLDCKKSLGPNIKHTYKYNLNKEFKNINEAKVNYVNLLFYNFLWDENKNGWTGKRIVYQISW